MKNFISRTWLIGIALLMAGCGGGGDSFQPRDLAFTRLGTTLQGWPVGGVMSSLPVGGHVFKTESEWNKAWDENVVQLYQRYNYSLPEKPTVDFSSSMLIGLSKDENYSDITKVVEEAERIRVEYQIFPPPTQFRAAEMAIGPNFDLIRIAATSKPVVFVSTGVAPDVSNVK